MGHPFDTVKVRVQVGSHGPLHSCKYSKAATPKPKSDDIADAPKKQNLVAPKRKAIDIADAPKKQKSANIRGRPVRVEIASGSATRGRGAGTG